MLCKSLAVFNLALAGLLPVRLVSYEKELVALFADLLVCDCDPFFDLIVLKRLSQVEHYDNDSGVA